MLQGHTDKWLTLGLEYSGGSLGQGLSFSLGVALAARPQSPFDPLRQQARPKYRVYCICGDGECHEGSVWEAAMAAGHFKVSNLVNIVDYNHFASASSIVKGADLHPFAEKWRAFGWWTVEVDGHNLRHIIDALKMADNIDGMPKCIIARTVKGKGIPQYEASHAHMITVTETDYEKLIKTIYVP